MDSMMKKKYPIWIFHVLGWISFWLLVFGFLISYFPFGISLFFSILHTASLVFLFYLNTLFLVERFWEKGRYASYAFWLLLPTAVVLAIRYYILQTGYFSHPLKPIISTQERTILFTAFNTFVVLLVSTLFQLLRNRSEREKKHLDIIHQQNEAQLQFLRSQINPHFLFNTLHNIYALAVIKSDQAPAMILQLSDLLRYVVYEGKNARVSLTREVEQIEGYIRLFQMRYPKPKPIALQVKGDLSGCTIEPMVLIPLVENCFKHCDLDINDQAFIQIDLEADHQAGVIKAATRNTFSKEDTQKDRIGGVGLENIRSRLDLKYGREYAFSHGETAEGIYQVSLVLPL